MALNPLQKVNYAMMRLMVRVMPSCRDITREISEAMDHELPLRKRLSIRLHVSMCSLCRRYEQQLHLLRHGLSDYADPEKNQTEPPLSPEARLRLQKFLDGEPR